MTSPLYDLAHAAGIDVFWRNVQGESQTVSDDTLRAVLAAIGFPAGSTSQIAESHAALGRESDLGLAPLITAEYGVETSLNRAPAAYHITLESGAMLEGHSGSLPPIFEAGYHRLEFAGAQSIVAVAPARAYTLADAARNGKIWGLAVQLYALRRPGDGGIGDFESLARFARAAARHGADAVAISPAHAQFSADVTRYSPYAPSSRAAYNVLHIPEPSNAAEDGVLIDWPAAGTAKLAALRARFETFTDYAKLDAFLQAAGAGMANHALFETLQAALRIPDWQNWPEIYRDPASTAVAQFKQANETDFRFHAYLQYRADEGLRAAQQAARDAGMKIGLIADLAVGADHAGSSGWSRQAEVLQGLEIGAPPDVINREGQSWGITAFSPRGLRNSGFTAFIEMLRHAMRHAGGVRIDHVMGLSRLWVVPRGMKSSEGAYLRLPVADLFRLVTLESQRHSAVVLGEDLGTLPDGFQNYLDGAGIAGLRVMWFERWGQRFAPPSHWTSTAVAMTTTHDLPSVAGWWRGTDIAWRTVLNMAGDNAADRAADRAELWAAFTESGAAEGTVPSPEDSAAVADAACVHLGYAACTLALLPIEDALAMPDQPNLPGTVDEHPNWRRRLVEPVDDILDRTDVARRLAALNEARGRA